MGHFSLKKIYYSMLFFLSFSVWGDDKGQRVTLASGTSANLLVPEAHQQKVVLMIHGWTGNMNEAGHLFLRFANQLAMDGIVS